MPSIFSGLLAKLPTISLAILSSSPHAAITKEYLSSKVCFLSAVQNSFLIKGVIESCQTNNTAGFSYLLADPFKGQRWPSDLNENYSRVSVDYLSFRSAKTIWGLAMTILAQRELFRSASTVLAQQNYLRVNKDCRTSARYIQGSALTVWP